MRLAAFLLLANFLIVSTVIPMRGSLSSDYTFESQLISSILNALAAGAVIVFSLRARLHHAVPSWLLFILVIAYLISLAVNALDSTRIVGPLLYMTCVILAFRKPTFLSALFRYMTKHARGVALIVAGEVAALNWSALRPTFYYPKTLGLEGYWVSLPFRNPNTLSVQLDTVILLLAAATIMYWTQWSTRGKLAAVAVWALLINVQLATLSRGGTIQLVVTVAVVALGLLRRSSGLVKAFGRLAVIGALFGVTAAMMSGRTNLRAELLQTVAADFEIESAGQLLFTRQVALDGVYQLLEEPSSLIFGRGGGQTGVAAKYFEGEDGASSHNGYVDIALQFGLPVLLAWMTCIAVVLSRAPRRLRERGLPPELPLVFSASLLHPMSEAVFFFRFGVASDIVRLAFLAFLTVPLAWTIERETKELLTPTHPSGQRRRAGAGSAASGAGGRS